MLQFWVAGILGIFLAGLAIRVFVLERTVRRFHGKTPEGMLMEHAALVGELKSETERLRDALAHLAANSAYSVQKVGIIRFNPFSDTGGDQSFAIALLDGEDNGVVLSSLYVQGRPMMYAKPIERGGSRYQLSQEEQAALAKAASHA